MPIGFAKSILTGTTGPAVTIIEVDSASTVSSYAHLFSRSYTTIQDPLGIVGTATTDNQTNSFGKYLPIANGTYTVELTAINGIPQSSSGPNFTATFSISIGRISSSSGSLTGHAVYGIGPQVTKSNNGDETIGDPGLPYNLSGVDGDTVTFDSSGNVKGVFTRFAAPYGGHTASIPSVRIQFTAT